MGCGGRLGVTRLVFIGVLIIQGACSVSEDQRKETGPSVADGGVPPDTGSAPTFDAVLERHTFPAVMQIDQRLAVTLEVRNVGDEPWLGDGSFRLNSANMPKALWSVEGVLLSTDVQPSQVATFDFEITATSTTGRFEHAWQMARRQGSALKSIGPVIRVPVEVAKLDAALVMQDVPRLMRPGVAHAVQLTLRNSGSRPWPVDSVRLATPDTHWSTTSVALTDVVAVGAQHTFRFDMTGPLEPGRYDSEWQLRFDDGRSRYHFGEAVFTRSIEVTSCGDGVVEAARGEQCDDSNREDADGCSETCMIEPSRVDLSSMSSSRTFLGTVAQGGLGNVAAANVVGDQRVNLLLGEGLHRQDVMPQRARAGRVNGYEVTLDFFDSTDPIATPDGTVFRILGADRNDNLAATKLASLLTARFRPGGVPDIIVSAPGATGENNDRPKAGEVFVLRGGAAILRDGGTVDLDASPATLLARIIGTSNGTTGTEITALGTGDVTGDASLDLVIGARGDDTNALDAGAVFVIDGSMLTGVIDLGQLAHPAIAAVIYGAAGGDKLGEFGAVGDFMGDGKADLVVGAPSHDTAGRADVGGVWGLVGPIEGTINLALGDADLTILGGIEGERVGIAMEIGHVTGSTTADLLLGASHLRNAGSQTGGVLIWVGPVAAGTLDLANAPSRPPDAVVYAPDPLDRGGAAMALGDINGDGYLDMAMAAPNADGPQNGRDQAGEVAVILGAPTLPAVIDLQITSAALTVWGAGAGDRMGAYRNNVALVDVDRDGAADLIVGSPLFGANREGRVDIFRSLWAPPD